MDSVEMVDAVDIVDSMDIMDTVDILNTGLSIIMSTLSINGSKTLS